VAPEEVAATDEPDDAGPRRGRLVAGIVSALVVLGAVVTIGAVALRRDDSPDPAPTSTSDFSQAPVSTSIGEAVPSPHSLLGTRQADGSVVFTWENPAPEAGDQYLWGVRQATGEPQLTLVAQPSATVPAADATGEVCIEVSIVRADRRASTSPLEGCAS